MRNPKRKVAFVLANTEHGTLIINRFDHQPGHDNQMLDAGVYEPQEVEKILSLLELRRRYFGDGVMAIDCGAHIGVHTIEWARKMTGWGSVIAIEAQERLFYAVAGNIAINNCFNARVIHAAVGATEGRIQIPSPDYLAPARFGSMELRPSDRNEFIGQKIDYAKTFDVRLLALDHLKLDRIDLIKIDVEGMELEVLHGARLSIETHRPILTVETIKTDLFKLRSWLGDRGYQVFQLDQINIVAIHPSDQTASHVRAV